MTQPPTLQPPVLILASASPRRQDLLRLAQVSFLCRPTAYVETRRSAEDALSFVRRMALEKALEAGRHATSQDPAWILTADTIVYVENGHPDILGKPVDETQARAFLEHLSGKVHEVLTAFCLHHRHNAAATPTVQTVRSRVRFRRLSDAEIASYLATREWADKAGAYGIQDQGALLVESLEGSYSNVIGLPLTEVLAALRTAGVAGWWMNNS